MIAPVAICTRTERAARYDAARYAIAIGWSALLNSIRYGPPSEIDSRSDPNRKRTAARRQTRFMSLSRANENGTDTPTISMNDGQMRS
jgi:hypothetical protein